MRWLVFFGCWCCWACQSVPAPSTTESLVVTDTFVPLSKQALPSFAPNDSAFLIYFPSTPQHTTYESQIDIGNLVMTQWVAQGIGGQYYVLSYADYPSAVLKLDSNQQLLKGVKDCLLTALHAKRSYQEQGILLDKQHTGIAFQAEAKRQHWHLNYRLYLVNQRLYQLGIHSVIGPISPQDSIDFFDSFRVLES